jgi:hypothetical protein
MPRRPSRIGQCSLQRRQHSGHSGHRRTRRGCEGLLAVPLRRLSVPLSRLSVPLRRLSVPLSRLSVPLRRLSVLCHAPVECPRSSLRPMYGHRLDLDPKAEPLKWDLLLLQSTVSG